MPRASTSVFIIVEAELGRQLVSIHTVESDNGDSVLKNMIVLEGHMDFMLKRGVLSEGSDSPSSPFQCRNKHVHEQKAPWRRHGFLPHPLQFALPFLPGGGHSQDFFLLYWKLQPNYSSPNMGIVCYKVLVRTFGAQEF